MLLLMGGSMCVSPSVNALWFSLPKVDRSQVQNLDSILEQNTRKRHPSTRLLPSSICACSLCKTPQRTRSRLTLLIKELYY